MSHKSENLTTPPNSSGNKSIKEMSWEEILALPAENISNDKILAFRKKDAAQKKK